jgi:hypothetical protein
MIAHTTGVLEISYTRAKRVYFVIFFLIYDLLLVLRKVLVERSDKVSYHMT